MSLTDSGIDTEVSLSHPQNEASPIFTTVYMLLPSDTELGMLIAPSIFVELFDFVWHVFAVSSRTV